jgi:predicted outer membrane repeat protein
MSSPTFRCCLFEENYGSAVLCSTWCAPHFHDCVFRNNDGWQGGGIYSIAAQPFVNRCSFFGNSSHLAGGAIMAHGGGVSLDNCEFEGNVAGACGGALKLLFGTQGEVSNCSFLNNSAEQAGAVFNFFADLVLEGCTFIGNTAIADGGAFASGKMSTTIIRNCTFYGNGARWGSLMCGESWTRLENTIIAFGAEGQAIQVANTVTLVCCDLYGNPGGDWTTGIKDQYGINGNFSADPLFCGTGIPMIHGDASAFWLHANSPCLPGNHPDSHDCGLIGAHGQGCGPSRVASDPKQPKADVVGAERTTWGRIKTGFRR